MGIVAVTAPMFRPETLPGGGGGGTASLNTGLNSHWHFDEVSGNRADAIGGVTLIPTGTINQIGGKLSNAVESPGAQQANRLTATTGLTWPASGIFEMNFWLYWYAITTGYAVNVATTAGTNRQLCVNSSSGAGGAGWSGFANGQQLNPAFTFSVNTWYNISIGDDGTQSFMYINNANLTTGARGSSVGKTVVSEISFLNNDGHSSSFGGRVDCASLWLGRALTAAERGLVYNGGLGLEYPY